MYRSFGAALPFRPFDTKTSSESKNTGRGDLADVQIFVEPSFSSRECKKTARTRWRSDHGETLGIFTAPVNSGELVPTKPTQFAKVDRHAETETPSM